MKYKNTISKFGTSLVMATALTFVASPLLARVNLVAIEGTWTPPGGSAITMWGFAKDTRQGCTSLPQWTVGPELTADDLQASGNGRLRIRLRNCLPEAVSIIIPGQKAIPAGGNLGVSPVPARDGVRITSFTAPTPVGETADYLWDNVDESEGTYLYMSGTHPALQVQMGLYGALKVGTYAGVSGDVTLLYSEIDPALHNPPTPATPLNYKPSYFLVNGEETVTLSAGNTSEPTVLSFLNAGLDFHVPALNGGGYMSLQAEDGNPYPFAKEQYSVNLAAGKTIDAFWQPTTVGEHIIYDRRGNGMIARLTVGAGAPGPAVANDTYEVDEDASLLVSLDDGVSANDESGFEVELVSGVSSGTLSCPDDGGFLCADGSFEYVPNLNFNGSDSFTYRTVAVTGTPSSNPATVTITVNPVNDPPVAADDAYDADAGVALVVAAPGVLANDQNIDGDTLTVTADAIFNADGSINMSAPVAGTYPYEVCDSGTPVICDTADVVITVTNDIPVAVDDAATVKRNSSPGTSDKGDPVDSDRNTFSVIVNDTDANSIDVTTVVVSGTTLPGSTVVANDDGTVSYTPPTNKRGTDTFTYTVMDTEGAISNQATVRVNIVRKRDLPPL